MDPAALFEKMTNQVLRMEALHNDDNRTADFVVEPGQ